MIQRLLLLTATLAALSSGSVFGLGLGELELDSALNQDFNANIVLTGTRGLAIEEVLPNLASQEDFNRVGVERNYLLTNLRFKTVQNDDGTLSVKVTSSRPIVEPFLNFIVEVLWPNGRILREYTVLLDPPVFSNRQMAPVAPSQTSAKPTPSQARPSQARPSPASAPRKATPRATPAAKQAVAEKPGNVNTRVTPERPAATQEGGISGEEYGMTGAGDTLWKIAMKVRPDSSVSIQQTMLALQKANPNAFINNNINLLKAGYVLRIPDSREIRRASMSEAVAEVRTQNREFQDIREGKSSVAQLDATRRTSGSGKAAGGRGDGELKLLAANRSAGQRAGDSDSRAVALEDDLAVAREDLDRARRANTEISVRMDDLAGQIETLNEIVKLKDDQLAALRAQLQKSQELVSEPAAVPEQAPKQGSLLTNPMVLIALALLLVGGVAGGLFYMRRRQQEEGLGEELTETSVSVEESIPEEESEDETVAEEEEIEEDEEDEELAPQTSDVISEAEIYIAYGRFPQAITFLQNAIAAEPDRADIQLKLLEVYVQTEDATAFNLQFDELKTIGDEESIEKGAALQTQIPGASETAEAAMEATIISSEPIVAIDEPEDDDDDLSFDLDDLDSDTADDDLDLGDELDLDDAEDLDLDLDLDLNEDLDLDEDQDATVEIESPVEEESEEAFELELEDDTDETNFDDTLNLDTEALDAEIDLPSDNDSLELDLEDSLELDLEDSLELDLEDGLELDLEDDGLDLDLGDGGSELDLEDSLEPDLEDSPGLDLDDDTADELDLEDSLEPDLEEDSLEPDLDDDDLNLDDDDTLTLDLEEDDDFDLEKDLEAAAEASANEDEDDGSIELNLDEEIDLDLDDELDLGDDDLELDLGDDDTDLENNLENNLDNDLELETSLDLDADADALELDASDLDLDDDSLELNLDGDDLDLDDEDLGELNLDEDASTKLDLARAYVDMGDNDGARNLLKEVLAEGTDSDIAEANELMAKLD